MRNFYFIFALLFVAGTALGNRNLEAPKPITEFSCEEGTKIACILSEVAEYRLKTLSRPNDYELLMLEKDARPAYEQLLFKLKDLKTTLDTSSDIDMKRKFEKSMVTYKSEIEQLESLLERTPEQLENADLKPSLPSKDTSLRYQSVPNKGLFSKTSGGAEADDVLQGNLGDCFILAPIMALAKVAPSWLQKKIMAISDSTFEISLFVKKNTDNNLLLPQAVRIDNRFVLQYGAPKYAKKSKDGEIWVMLLEKALAKLWGGYHRLDLGGDPATVFQALTGLPVAEYALDMPLDSMRSLLGQFVKAQKPITVATKKAEFVPNLYSLLETESNEQCRLIALPDGTYLYCHHVYVLDQMDQQRITLLNPNTKGRLYLDWETFFHCFDKIYVAENPALESSKNTL